MQLDTATLSKGEQTRAAILAAGLRIASSEGLNGITIGQLADVMDMSKSGVFAHFGSREELQIAVVSEYHRRFEQAVFFPALKAPRGLPRLAKMLALWVKQVTQEIDEGCLYISGAVEFDSKPGAVQDELRAMVQTWLRAVTRATQLAVNEKHLTAATPVESLVFQFHGQILALHHDARFLRQKEGFTLVKQGFQAAVAPYLTPHSPPFLP